MPAGHPPETRHRVCLTVDAPQASLPSDVTLQTSSPTGCDGWQHIKPLVVRQPARCNMSRSVEISSTIYFFPLLNLRRYSATLSAYPAGTLSLPGLRTLPDPLPSSTLRRSSIST